MLGARRCVGLDKNVLCPFEGALVLKKPTHSFHTVKCRHSLAHRIKQLESSRSLNADLAELSSILSITRGPNGQRVGVKSRLRRSLDGQCKDAAWFDLARTHGCLEGNACAGLQICFAGAAQASERIISRLGRGIGSQK